VRMMLGLSSTALESNATAIFVPPTSTPMNFCS
jgi:hypothetical protein